MLMHEAGLVLARVLAKSSDFVTCASCIFCAYVFISASPGESLDAILLQTCH